MIILALRAELAKATVESPAAREASRESIEWVINKVLDWVSHLGFHVDYNIDPPSQTRPLVSFAEPLRKDW